MATNLKASGTISPRLGVVRRHHVGHQTPLNTSAMTR
jgi:hypothetical protein